VRGFFCRAKAAALGFFLLGAADVTAEDDVMDACFFLITNSNAFSFSLSKCIFSSMSDSADANDEFPDMMMTIE
jgi:hypothetical protein